MLNSAFVSQSLNLPTDRHLEFTNVSTDSRTVKPGDLFVAIKGETFDGNLFVEKAILAGAKGILCEAGHAPEVTPKGVVVFEVSDTLLAFRRIAQDWRAQFSIPIICVAGSVGKTTTKEILGALLQGRWPAVLRTEGSLNGYLGIPITLMKITNETKAAVIEVGIDEIGAMAQHLDVVRPTHAIVTALGPEHLERLKNLETVAAEECIALTAVDRWGGFTSVNRDEPEIVARTKGLNSERSMGFQLVGSDKNIETSLSSICGAYDSKENKVTVKSGLYAGQTWTLPIAGPHNARNFLGALTIAAQLRLTADQVSMGLKSFTQPWGRSETRTSKSGLTVICDFYNANPSSMRAAFSVIEQTPRRNLFLCLGDMLELGIEELQFHRDLAPDISALNPTGIYLYGPRMRSLYDELRKSPLVGKVQYKSEFSEIAEDLKAKAGRGDLVLLKGSRGMRFEKLWELLNT